MINVAVGLIIAALPWLASGVVSAADLPPILAYLLFPGRSVVVLLGSIVVLWTVLRDHVSSDTLARVEVATRSRGFALAAFALVAFVAFARVPQVEKEAEAFGGDEPKYLRIAMSLLHDTDADVSGGRTETPDFSLRMKQVRNLVLVGRDSVVDLFRPVEIPEGHVWNAGNWTVRALDGGLYHLQPPGLPALVAIALGIGEIVLPERDPGISVAALLSLIWLFAARELWLLARDMTQDTLGAAVFGAIVLLSAPVFVGGYQLFPEALMLWVFPWLLRRLRSSERPLGFSAALGCGLLTGFLLWVHPKLTIVAALFALMIMVRPQTSVRTKAVFTLGFGLTAFTALLYCHHLSGLFRPEGLYIRQAEEYVGSPNPFSFRFIAGLIKSLVGGRDGLLIFAPVLALGFAACRSWRVPSRSSLEMWGLFAVVWLTSAVHDGASLGSPARLMAPVVFVPAFFLVRSLRDEAPSSLKAATILLLVIGLQITATHVNDWRRSVNPFRTMFANEATNFEPSLPGNSFSDEAYLIDIKQAVLILAVIAGLLAVAARATRRATREYAPARFGLGVLATVAILAYGLRSLGP